MLFRSQSLTMGAEALDDRLSWARRGNLGKIRNRVAWLESVVPARAAEMTNRVIEDESKARHEVSTEPIDPSHREVNASALRDGWVRGAASPSTEKAGDIAARILPMRKEP